GLRQLPQHSGARRLRPYGRYPAHAAPRPQNLRDPACHSAARQPSFPRPSSISAHPFVAPIRTAVAHPHQRDRQASLTTRCAAVALVLLSKSARTLSRSLRLSAELPLVFGIDRTL